MATKVGQVPNNSEKATTTLDDTATTEDILAVAEEHRDKPIIESCIAKVVSDESYGGETPPEEEEDKQGCCARYWIRWRPFWHGLIWSLITAWWIAGLVLHRDRYLIPLLLWLAITAWFIFQYVPNSVVAKPLQWIWITVFVQLSDLISQKYQTAVAGSLVVGGLLLITFLSPESGENNRKNRAFSTLGLLGFYIVLYATSANRKKIVWKTVIVGLLSQYVLALFVLRTKVGYDIFAFISFLARKLLGFSIAGMEFLTTSDISKIGMFLIAVLPAIIFFVALVQMLYHLGILQWVLIKVAYFVYWGMKISGAEAVTVSACPFVGQGESAILIKPFIAYLTKSECHQIMCSGFATIAGSVLIAYISFGLNPQVLVSSCVMSIPASIICSKMRMPETEESLTEGKVNIPPSDEPPRANFLHAFSDGAWTGLMIAGLIAANLLVIIALISMLDATLGWIGSYIQLPQLSSPLILGYLCYPISLLLGIPLHEAYRVAQLIGIKLLQNEFIAYISLSSDPTYTALSTRSQLIATYALCGFGNIGSLGIQLGILGQLGGVEKKRVFAQVGFSALLTGVLATFMSASIAGMVLTDERAMLSGAQEGS